MLPDESYLFVGKNLFLKVAVGLEMIELVDNGYLLCEFTDKKGFFNG